MMANVQPVLAVLLVSSALAGFGLAASPMEPSPAPPVPALLGASLSDSAKEVASDASRANEPHSAEADDRLHRANQHLTFGKQLYFKGDLEGARREFDAAVNALLNAPENLPDHRRLERRLDEIADLIYRFDIEKLGAGESENAVVFDQAPIDVISHMTFPVDQTLAPKVDREVKVTTSGIPLELSDPVLSYIHYFSTDAGRNTLLSGFRRAGRYKPMIQRILKEEGVPEELIYLAQAESGFLPRAVSYKSAAGMWQFIAGTGQLYSLTRTSSYDERFDPERATRAAARHLKDLFARYGDWYLALAAYNCGAGNVDRAVERTGYADYWQLLKLHALPKETANYVPIIVAMTIMAKNPQDYGLEQIGEDDPLDYENIILKAATNVSLIADAAQQPVSFIRDLNPALLGGVAPAGYEVHLPKGSGQTTLAAIESVPAANRNAWRLHHVSAGETLDAIAKEYHTRPASILAVNDGADALDAGDVLLIPAVYHEPPKQNHSRRRATSARRRVANSPRRQAASKSASQDLSSRVIHRRAALRTASSRG
jgi:membrane-bound lytic murein transglycosylase D